jgi:hypothetical protein
MVWLICLLIELEDSSYYDWTIIKMLISSVKSQKNKMDNWNCKWKDNKSKQYFAILSEYKFDVLI